MRATGDRGAWLLAGLVVVLLLGVTGVAGSQPAAADPKDDGYGAPTTWYVAVDADGDARFTITMRFSLSTDNETRAFRRLSREFENGTAETLSVETFERAAGLASEATGRPMEISGVDRSSRIENDTGALVLSFSWSGFARTPGDRIELGDAFRTPSGTWLPRLTERQELVVAVPRGYAPTSLEWSLRNGSVYIRGPVSFDPGEPAASFRLSGPATPTPTMTQTPTPATPTSTPTPTPTVTATPTDDNATVTPQGNPPGAVLGVLAALALIAVLVYAVRERDDGLPGLGTTGGGDGGSPDAAAGSADEPGPTAGEEPAEGDETAAGGDAVGGDDPSGGEVLLSDEERVLELLAENGGRMKQAAIVEETDWSNAKVSQLLSEMADDDEVEKLRIGRENLITLPEERPEGVD